MAMAIPGRQEAAAEEVWTVVYQAIDRGLQPGSVLEIPSSHLAAIKQSGLGELVAEYFGAGLDDDLREEVVPTFWRHFQGGQDAGEVSPRWVYHAVRGAVAYAAETMRIKRAMIQGLGEALDLQVSHIVSSVEGYQERLAALIFNTAPPGFDQWMGLFFRTTLKAMHQRWKVSAKKGQGGEDLMMIGSDEEEEEEEEEGEGMEVDGETEGVLSSVGEEEVMATWEALRELQWLPLLQSTITDVLRSEIEQHIEKTCKGRYERRMLDVVCRWKEAVLMRWLGSLLGGPAVLQTLQQMKQSGVSEAPSSSSSSSQQQLGGESGGGGGGGEAAALDASLHVFKEWQLRHDFSVFEVFSSVRISEMFDIIREFPDSLPAVRELREALEITQQHKQLATSLRETVKKRLLHNGANTMQIIDVYISTIKALRVVDPTDVLLEAVARPIRAYLRARKDTVRCIVTSLTDENSGDLHEELRRQDALPLEHGVDSDDEDGGPGENWQPPSHDADVSNLSSKRRGDILSMLISIYGSKELFVSEYRLMLADKLLNNLTYDTDKEVQNLELLKLRFGEASMHHCEIMIRDVDDSKRVNTNVRSSMALSGKRRAGGARGSSSTQGEAVVDATIVSHHFWPPLQDDDLELHPRVSSILKEFGDKYAVLKNPRKLDFKQQLGTVELELDFDGVRRPFTVSAFHATLIMHFEDQEEWELQDLSRVTRVSPDVVSKKMMLWVNQGVIAMSPSRTGGGGALYTVIKDAAQRTHGGRSLEDDELLVAAVSPDAQQAQVLKVYRDYITGMLSNHGGRTLKQIHNTLKIWVGDQKYTLKLPELQDLMARLCAEEGGAGLEFVDGTYQLAAKARPSH